MRIGISGWPPVRQVHRLIVQEFIEKVLESHQITILQPPGIANPLTQVGMVHELESSTNPWSRLVFEQMVVPQAAAHLGLELLLYPHLTAPLRSSVPVLALNIPEIGSTGLNVISRIGSAIAAAGARGAEGVIGISDLEGAHAIELPPYLDSRFDPHGANSHGLELPSDFVLCLDTSVAGLRLLLAAWSWVDSALGDTVSLVVAGIDAPLQSELHKQAEQLGLSQSLITITDLDLPQVPQLYRDSTVLLMPEQLPWGQPLRWAMATGVPIVSIQKAEIELVVGQAAYLVPERDARKLGAACLTLLVEPELARSLSEKGLLKAAEVHRNDAGEVFTEAIRAITHNTGV